MNDFRRTGQRDERRRRVLADERLGRLTAAEDPLLPDRARTPLAYSPRYTEAASMDAQPRLIDLVPKRIAIYALLLFAGVLAVTALEALYYWMPRLAGLTTDGRVAAFDLDSEGSLAAFFSSVILALAGVAALLVWSLRRHRVDDYHGRYRIWLWTAAAWFAMSVDESCSLHEGFKELMAHLTGQRLFGDGSLWWVSAYVVLLGWLAGSLVFEMRACRTSLAALVLAGICWAVAVAMQMELLLPQHGAIGVMWEEGLEMLGDICVLFSMTFHARHVILDAQGLLGDVVAKPKRSRKRKSTEAATSAALAAEDQAAIKIMNKPAAIAAAQTATVKAGPRATSTIGGLTSSTSAVRADASQAFEQNRRLSKAERRAIKRQGREEAD